jgi:predicted transcriptional regulator
MGKSTKRKLPSNPDDVISTMPRARIDEIIDEPPTPGPHEEDMDDIDYESKPEPEPISLPKPHAKAVAFVGPISPKSRPSTAAIPRIRSTLQLPLPLPIIHEPATDPMALMQAQLATLIAQDAQREKVFAVQSALLAQLQSQSTSTTAPALASGVENFQNIIKNAKLTKFHGDALVDKMSFATWITSHVKAVIGVTTDQHVQQLAHQYLSSSALSQSKATQRRPQADATPHERFTSWMAEKEKTYPGPDSMDRLTLFSGMRMTIATPTVQLWLIAVRESLDACPGMVSKVDQPDEYDILVVNKFVLGLPTVIQHTVRQFHKLTDDIRTCASIEDIMDRAQTYLEPE